MDDFNDALMTNDEDIELAARSLKAMSHPIRLKILCALGDDEVSVQDIVDKVGTSQSNVFQHLGILREKDILITRKDANRVGGRGGGGRAGRRGGGGRGGGGGRRRGGRRRGAGGAAQ